MTSPVVSGIIANVLAKLDDESAAVFPSGKVQQCIFASLPTFNGLLGDYYYSGDVLVGQITPEISGTMFQGLLELYVASQLSYKECIRAARGGSLKEVSEGDSKVVMNDSAGQLSKLYDKISEEFDKTLKQVKYAIVSQSASIVRGADGSAPLVYPAAPYPVYLR